MSRVFTDVETAKRAGRTSFGEMLNYIREHDNCRVILVEKTDRLYRNIKDWVTLDEYDLEIHLVKENKIISRDSNSSEKFLHGIKVLMAKNYIDNLSEESSKGMREKARQGLWPSVAPIGYVNSVSSNGKKVIIPDPERAEIVSKLFEWYSEGDISIKDLAKKAREAGLTHKGKGTPLPPSSIHRVLKNRIYYGEFKWAGMIYHGKHKPIVTRHLWQKVQDRFENRNTAKFRKSKNDFAYSRLIKCGHCGCAMVGELKKGKYTYYHCTGYKGSCSEPYTREEVLDDQFYHFLDALYFDDEVSDYIRTKLYSSRNDKRRFHRKILNKLREEYKQIMAKLDTMYEDKLNGLITGDIYTRKSADYVKRLDEVAAAIDMHENANTEKIDKSITLFELARNARSMYEKRAGSEKRRLLNKLLSNCYWNDGQLSAQYRQPFGMLADTNAFWKEQKAAGAENLSVSEIWYPVVDALRTSTGVI